MLKKDLLKLTAEQAYLKLEKDEVFTKKISEITNEFIVTGIPVGHAVNSTVPGDTVMNKPNAQVIGNENVPMVYLNGDTVPNGYASPGNDIKILEIFEGMLLVLVPNGNGPTGDGQWSIGYFDTSVLGNTIGINYNTVVWNDGSNKNVVDANGEFLYELPATQTIQFLYETPNSNYACILFNGSNGELATGYVLMSDGRFLRSSYIKSGSLNPPTIKAVSGVWKEVSNKWYYYINGVMQTGWIEVKGLWYFLNETGVMQTGWVEASGLWYYLNSTGVMQTGWIEVKGLWYYLNSTGAMQTGWVESKGVYYYLNSSGAMETNTTVDGYKIDSTGASNKPVAKYSSSLMPCAIQNGNTIKVGQLTLNLNELNYYPTTSDAKVYPNGFTENYINMVKCIESFNGNAYQDLEGNWTIGYGHKFTPGVERNGYTFYTDSSISITEANELLITDLNVKAQIIKKDIQEYFPNFQITNGCQFDAILDLVFNGGSGCFYATHNIFTDCINKQYSGLQFAFGEWCHAKLKAYQVPSGIAGTYPLFGLYKRRLENFIMFTTGLYVNLPSTDLPAVESLLDFTSVYSNTIQYGVN